MPFFDGRVGRVYYRHWAAAQPRAVLVFLHGFGEHSGLYHRYAAALNARDIDLWALDEIGHGLSEGERGHFGSIDDLAANGGMLAGLAEAAAPGLPLVIAGHSLGTLAALYLALDDPARFRGVVISGAPLSPLEWLEEALAAGQQEVDLDPAALSADPFYLDALENDPLAFTSADVAALLGAAFPPAWQRLERELPGLAPLPVLAVHGSEDQIAPIGGVLGWRDRLKSLRVAEFRGSAHDILNEAAHREVAATVADFVLSVSRPAGT
jgi:alpha-beta hydrolase superfamily lysophospholipase